VANGAYPWKRVFWREWRKGEDEECAERLFRFIADDPAGAEVTAVMVLFGSFAGLACGLILGLMALNWGAPLAEWAPHWSALLGWVAGGVLLLALAALLFRWLLGDLLTWRTWLEHLSPAEIIELQPGAVALAGLAGAGGYGLLLWFLRTVLVGAALATPGAWMGERVLLLLVLAVSLVGGTLLQRETGLLLPGLALGLGGAGVAVFLIGPGPAVVCGLALVLGLCIGTVWRALGLPSEHVYAARHLWCWWTPRPSPAEMEAALTRACQSAPEINKVWEPALRYAAQLEKTPESPFNMIRDFRNTDWMARFGARHALVALGGESVEVVRGYAANPLMVNHHTAIWILHHISRDTNARFAHRHPPARCARCVVTFAPRTVRISWHEHTRYMGCRQCGQTWEVLPVYQAVVATLDSRTPASRIEQGEILRVNWLAERKLFDFDRVEIIAANDEEVERFAVQVGNDTDPVRKQRYRKMACFVAPQADVSENSRRILRQMFRQVSVRHEEAP